MQPGSLPLRAMGWLIRRDLMTSAGELTTVATRPVKRGVGVQTENRGQKHKASRDMKGQSGLLGQVERFRGIDLLSMGGLGWFGQ